MLVTAVLLARRLRPTAVLAGYPVATAVAYLLLATSHLPWVFVLAALVIGFFAGGGLFQLAVVVLAGLFPTRKGVATSLIGLASGASAFVMPYVSGLLVGDGSHAATAYRWITVLGLVVAVLAAGLGTVVRARHARPVPPVPSGT